jgi:hypothetical protein
MAVFDDGGEPALYAGGFFQHAGAVTLSNFARWNGTAWSAVGNFSGNALAMAIFDDGAGGGPALYVAGAPGGTLTQCIARWNGSSWSTPVGGGLTGGTSGAIGRALAVYDSGSGPGLYIGGSFTSAGGVPANNIARYGPRECFPNCDGSLNASACPTLNVQDFTCFLQRYAAGDQRANCDASATAPTLNVADFTCFLQRYVAGCP